MEYGITIYFVRNPETDLVKIGKTGNFSSRYASLCREAGCKLEVLLTLDGEDTERKLHEIFSKDKAHGEWFRFSDQLKDVIKRSKKSRRLSISEEKEGFEGSTVDELLSHLRKIEREYKLSSLTIDRLAAEKAVLKLEADAKDKESYALRSKEKELKKTMVIGAKYIEFLESELGTFDERLHKKLKILSQLGFIFLWATILVTDIYHVMGTHVPKEDELYAVAGTVGITSYLPRIWHSPARLVFPRFHLFLSIVFTLTSAGFWIYLFYVLFR